MSSPEPRTWSVSGARAYKACPRQFFLVYVAHAPQEPGFDSIRGQVLHAGIAAGYSTHAAAVAEGRDMVVAIRRSHVAVEYAVCEAAARLDHEQVDEAIDTVIECLNELCPEPGDEVLLVEQSMHIEVGGVPIQYRADAVYRRGGTLVVRDWKSRKDLPRRRELPGDRQLALGALCAARTYGDTKVTVEIASIGSGVAVDSPIDRSAAQEAGRWVAETACDADADRVFTPRPGTECARCSVRVHCPVFATDEALVITPESLLAGRIRQAGRET